MILHSFWLIGKDILALYWDPASEYFLLFQRDLLFGRSLTLKASVDLFFCFRIMDIDWFNKWSLSSNTESQNQGNWPRWLDGDLFIHSIRKSAVSYVWNIWVNLLKLMQMVFACASVAYACGHIFKSDGWCVEIIHSFQWMLTFVPMTFPWPCNDKQSLVTCPWCY